MRRSPISRIGRKQDAFRTDLGGSLNRAPSSVRQTSAKSSNGTPRVLPIHLSFILVSFVSLNMLRASLVSPNILQSYNQETIQKLHPFSNNRTNVSSSTIVTAYYALDSKHSIDEYWNWIDNFLSLEDPMVIFTSSDLVERFLTGRAKYNASHKTKVVSLELNQTDASNMFNETFWKKQFSMDPEKRIHKSYFLYWAWLSKPAFLKRAIFINPFESTFFAWVDVGYFRTKEWNGRLLLNMASFPEALGQDQVLILDMSEPEQPVHGLGLNLGAGFIGGYVKGILRFNELFYKFLLEHQSEFIGKEQFPMWRTCFETIPSPCLMVRHSHNHASDPWFYMAPYLILGLKNETYTWEPSKNLCTGTNCRGPVMGNNS